MPFSEAVGLQKFTVELTEAVEDEFPKRMLVPLGMQAGDLGIKLAHKLAKYSNEVANGIRTGELTPLVSKGREFLDAITTSRGAFAGKAIAANGAKATSVAASGAGIAIQLAYMFSSMDTLKRLQSLDRKTDLLLAARKFDQLGRLERIYTHAGELMHMGESIDFIANDIHRLASELTELRSVWRQEVRNKIQERDPEKIENDWYFGFGDSKKTKKLTKEMEEFDPLHAEIHLIRFTFVLQWALMATIGRESTFGKITCDGEQNEWRDLADLIERKAEIIDARVSDQPRRAVELADAVWGVRKLCKDLGTSNSKEIIFQPTP